MLPLGASLRHRATLLPLGASLRYRATLLPLVALDSFLVYFPCLGGNGAMTVKLTPTGEVKPPFDLGDETLPTFQDELTVAGNTAELLVDLGAPLEIERGQPERELDKLVKTLKKKKAPTELATAFAAQEFLKTYGQNLAIDAATTRAAITNKLLEIANCGDTKYELKALELLGKHSDIGLFTDRSEITINYRDPAALEEAIKERVKRLLNAEIIDVTPVTGKSLAEELGLLEGPDVEEAEFDELGAPRPYAEDISDSWGNEEWEA